MEHTEIVVAVTVEHDGRKSIVTGCGQTLDAAEDAVQAQVFQHYGGMARLSSWVVREAPGWRPC